MAFKMLYPDEHPVVHRHSSIDQFRGFFATMKKGGWAPIVFDQLDSITCGKIKHHPVVLSLGDDIGYIFKDAQCSYTLDKFVYFDKQGVEQKLLPSCQGGNGEFYDSFFKGYTFVDFDGDTSLGSHNVKRLRVGTSYVTSDNMLPPVE